MGMKFALRQLRQSPGFALIAIATLALGIGSNAAIFSFLNSWILRPSQFPDLDRLVVIYGSERSSGQQFAASPADWRDWREKSEIFEDLAAARNASFNLTGVDEPVRIAGYNVSSNFFRTLGMHPALGRDFTDAEEQPAQSRVVVLAHSLWRDRFSSDPDVLGKTITLDGAAYTIVGVMPENFQYIPMGLAEIFTPLALTPEQAASRDGRYLNVDGRLKPGIGKSRAIAAMTALAASLEKEYPASNGNRGVIVRTLQEEIDRQSGNTGLKIVFAIVSFVLLMACANVANLIMSRASGRRKEMAIRLAIGAGRGKLLRRLLGETLILFFAGAALGIPVPRWTVVFLVHAIPARSLAYLPNFGRVDLDWQVLAFMALIALASGIVFGLAPALEATRFDVNGMLKDSGGRGTSAGAGRFRKILVAGEMALAVIVVVSGALLANSFTRLMRTDPGFDGQRVFVAQITLPAKYQSPASWRQFYDAVVDRLAAIPGVERAATGRFTPFSNSGSIVPLFIEGEPAPADGRVPVTRRNAVSPGYIEALSIPLLSGRTISREDSADAKPVAMVNETLVKRYFAGANPLGKKIRLSRTDPVWYTVVGVVKEVKYYYAPAAPPENQVYLAAEQAPAAGMSVLIRMRDQNRAAAQSIRAVVRGVDPNQPVSEIKSISEQIDDSVAPDRILTQLSAAFGLLALFLAAIGIYGVMAYSVAQRTREIGVRMALGARAGDVLAMIVRQGMVVVLSGMIAGSAGAIGMAQLLATFLYGVKANDAATFTISFVLLAAVALAACAIPARRAAKVDPVVALRYE
jgi:putative ABC transport system permease protein